VPCSLSTQYASPGQVVNVSITVTNNGQMNASETVLVFVRQLYRAAIMPEASIRTVLFLFSIIV
jgi:hypothetical protein